MTLAAAPSPTAPPVTTAGLAASRRALSRAAVTFPIIIAAWALLTLLYITGPVASDDFGYIRIARHPNPDPFAITYPYARFGFWYPLNQIITATAGAWWGFAVIPFAASLIALTAVHRLVSRCVNPRAALLAVLSLGFVPLFVVFSTISLPDTLGAALLAVVLLLSAPPLIDPDAKAPARACLAGGFLAAFSFCAKETVILACPALFLFVLLFKRRHRWAWTRLALIAAGAIVGLGLDMAVLTALTGDPLFHIKTMSAGCRGYGSPLADNRLSTILWYVTDYVRLIADPRRITGPWGAIYLVAILFALRRRNDLSRLVLCCVLVIGGYLSVGTVDFADYFPIYHQSRYRITMLPLGAILAAQMLDTIARRDALTKRFVATVLVVSLLASGAMPNASAANAYYAPTVSAARRLLASPNWPSPSATLLASPDAVQRIDVLVESTTHRPVRPIEHPAPETPDEWISRHGGAFVLVTQNDRRTKNRKADDRVLPLRAIDALNHFPRVASAAPDHDRISALAAAIGLTDPRLNQKARIDLYRIPEKPLN